MTTQPIGSGAHQWVNDVLTAAVPQHASSPDAAVAMGCRLGCQCDPIATHTRPGRPALPEEDRRGEVIRLRVTRAELSKYESLGGSAWLRSMLQATPQP